MKKLLITLIFVAQSALFAQINAVVSILPEMTFVKAIGGEHVHTSLMVQPGDEPENYEPKPSQMKDVMKAHVYFAIGVEFEEVWLKKFMNQNKNMIVVDVTKGITKIGMPTFMDTHKKMEEGHKDPHVWTSPKEIKIIALNIYNALADVDPAHQSYYKARYDAFLAKIDSVDQQLKEILKDVPHGTKFMVFHPAWGYFAKEYHLTQFPIQVEGKDPKPKMLAHIIDTAKKEHIKAIFTQPEFSDHVANVIAKELNIRVIKATPLAANWSQNLINFATSIAKDQR
ncbi:metal ABC transporter solute-binding protein, Zn/Mn family [Sulfurospirillum sp. 1612]|uniref:metal ABC transporter solute-binding protein, Zn/Mn family n=1 Tax=Sulfurospirillum sp. 1612 TaxID=3094835 RepID=UPI002F953585